MHSPDATHTAVVSLLNGIPNSWAKLDQDSLSEAEEQALLSLTATGLVERRFHIRLRMFNNDVAFRASLTMTGENGLFEAMERLLAGMWHDWSKSYETWMNSETRNTAPFFCQAVPPNQWRLTFAGAAARQIVNEKEPNDFVDYVLKRGPYVGRRPIAGKGYLHEFAKYKPDDSSGGVEIANWAEGGDVIGQVIAKTLQAYMNGQQTSNTEERTRPSDDGQGNHETKNTCEDASDSKPPPDFKHTCWPGSDQWENWGVGLAKDGTWHLYHFHRKNYCWIRHHYAALSIPSGIADGLARKFLRFGFIAIKDAYDVLGKHAKHRVRQGIREQEVVRKTKSPMSRLRSAIRDAVHSEGHRPKGRSISSPTKRTRNWQARVRFGVVEKRETGGYCFKSHY